MRLDHAAAYLPFMRDPLVLHVHTDAGEAAVSVKGCVFDPDTSTGIAMSPDGWNTTVVFLAEDWPERSIPSVGSTIDPDTAGGRWPLLTVAKAWRHDGLVFLSCTGMEVAL